LGSRSLPRDTRALLAEYLVGLVAELQGLFPTSLVQGRRSYREPRQSERVSVASLLRQVLSSLQQLPRLPAIGLNGGLVRSVEHQRTSDPAALTTRQGEQEKVGCKVRSAYRVHHTESHAHRPARVDTDQITLGYLAFVTFAKAETPQATLGTVKKQGQQRSTRCLRAPDTNSPEQRTRNLESLIDMTADEQLLGRSPLKLESLRRLGRLRRCEVRRCGLPTSTCPHESIATQRLDQLPPRVVGGYQLENRSVEIRGMVESQCLGCLCCGDGCVFCRLPGFPRTLPMHR
jgi:hypothetical protein